MQAAVLAAVDALHFCGIRIIRLAVVARTLSSVLTWTDTPSTVFVLRVTLGGVLVMESKLREVEKGVTAELVTDVPREEESEEGVVVAPSTPAMQLPSLEHWPSSQSVSPASHVFCRMGYTGNVQKGLVWKNR